METSRIDIKFAGTFADAREYKAQGYAVVDTAYHQSGGQDFIRQPTAPITDDMAHLARDSLARQGTRLYDPRFVTNTRWNAAEAFAIAAKAGLLPPYDETNTAYNDLVETIDLMSHDAAGRRLALLPEGSSYAVWSTLLSQVRQDRLGTAIRLWDPLIRGKVPGLPKLQAELAAEETHRYELAQRQIEEAKAQKRVFGGKVLYIASKTLEVNVFLHMRRDNRGASSLIDDWKYPLVVVSSKSQTDPGTLGVAISMPNKYVGQQLLGRAGEGLAETVTGRPWTKRRIGATAMQYCTGGFADTEPLQLAIYLAQRADEWRKSRE